MPLELKPKPKAIILDIEGTTTLISFVHDVLFPYASQNVGRYIDDHWNDNELQDDIKLLREQVKLDVDSGLQDVPIIVDDDADVGVIKKSVIDNVNWQMNYDRKTKALKELQGHIWKNAFQNGLIKGHLFNDVPTALNNWKNNLNINIYIYSSGSVFAQKLLLGHSDYGNMLHLIDGHFDTTIGSKLESSSYLNIANELKLEPNQILFLTDSVKEAKAAKEAQFKTILMIRPGNQQLTDEDKCEFLFTDSFLNINLID